MAYVLDSHDGLIGVLVARAAYNGSRTLQGMRPVASRGEVVCSNNRSFHGTFNPSRGEAQPGGYPAADEDQP